MKHESASFLLLSFLYFLGIFYSVNNLQRTNLSCSEPSTSAGYDPRRGLVQGESNPWPPPATGPANDSLSECLNSSDSLCGAPAEPRAVGVKVSLQPDEWPAAFCSPPLLRKDHAEILLFCCSEICQIKSLPSLSHTQKAQTLKHFTDPVQDVFLSFLKYYYKTIVKLLGNVTA